MELLGKEGVYRLDLRALKAYSPRVADSLILDIREVYAAEARKDELARVNRATAPELSNALGRGHGLAAEAFVQLHHLVNLADNAIKRREAIVILDEAQKVLLQKGLTTTRSPGGAADYRASVVVSDAGYIELQELHEQLKSLRGLVQVKMDGLNKHFYAVQAVYKAGDNTFGMAAGSHRDTSGPGVGSSTQYSDIDAPPSHVGTVDEDGFGTPRY